MAGTSSSATAYDPGRLAELPALDGSSSSVGQVQVAVRTRAAAVGDRAHLHRARAADVAGPKRDVGPSSGAICARASLSTQFAMMNGVLDGGSADARRNDGFDVSRPRLRASVPGARRELLQGSRRRRGGQLRPPRNPARPNLRPHRRPRTRSSATSAGRRGPAGGARTRQLRVAPQAYWYWGAFGLLGEWSALESERAAGN